VATELIKTPDIRSAIVRGLQQGGRIVQNYAVINVTGRILKRASGKLASSIYAKVRKTRAGGILRVGTKLHYGRDWERGFYHYGGRSKPRGKFMGARPWLRPAAEQALPEISNFIKLEVDRELKAISGKITIDLKLS
jgi:phage gpG-like protein